MRKKHHTTSAPRGMTLIEIMVTIAVAGVFATLALPSFGNMAYRHRVSKEKAKLRQLVRSARDEARMRNRCVQLKVESGRTITVTYFTSCSGVREAMRDGTAPSMTGPNVIERLNYRFADEFWIHNYTRPTLDFLPNGSVAAPSSVHMRMWHRRNTTATWSSQGIDDFNIWRATGAVTE